MLGKYFKLLNVGREYSKKTKTFLPIIKLMMNFLSEGQGIEAVVSCLPTSLSKMKKVKIRMWSKRAPH